MPSITIGMYEIVSRITDPKNLGVIPNIYLTMEKQILTLCWNFCVSLRSSQRRYIVCHVGVTRNSTSQITQPILSLKS